MKSISIFLSSLVFVASSCHPSYQSTNAVNDDVYYSSKSDPSTYSNPVSSNSPDEQTNSNQNQAQTQPDQYSSGNRTGENNSETTDSRFDYSNSTESTQNQASYDGSSSSSTSSTTGKDGNTYITNNYYDKDDYYDYAYTARIRRFHQPCGWGYYDNYYTNSYWYDYNPNHWGMSIYLGYNWWGPGYGYNYNPYSYNPYYGGYYSDPYFAYNNGYQNGYNAGYWNGYYSGLYNNNFNNPYYYNSYDNNTHYYYGPRGTKGKNTHYSTGKPVGQLYEATIQRAKKEDIKNVPGVRNSNTGSGTIKTENGSTRGNTGKNQGTIRNPATPVKDGANIKGQNNVPGGIRNNEPVRNFDNSIPDNTGGVKTSGNPNQIRNTDHGIRKPEIPEKTGGVRPTKENSQDSHSNPNKNDNMRNKNLPGNNPSQYDEKENRVPNENEKRNRPKLQEEGSSEQSSPSRGEYQPRNENRNTTDKYNSNSNSTGQRQQSAPPAGERRSNRQK